MEIAELLLDVVSPVVLWGAFAVFLTFFGIVSTALMYHWKHYNIDDRKSKAAMRLYFAVSGLFIFVMLISLISYSS